MDEFLVASGASILDEVVKNLVKTKLLKLDNDIVLYAPTDEVFVSLLKTLGLSKNEFLSLPTVLDILKNHLIITTENPDNNVAVSGVELEYTNTEQFDVTGHNSDDNFSEEMVPSGNIRIAGDEIGIPIDDSEEFEVNGHYITVNIISGVLITKRQALLLELDFVHMIKKTDGVNSRLKPLARKYGVESGFLGRVNPDSIIQMIQQYTSSPGGVNSSSTADVLSTPLSMLMSSSMSSPSVERFNRPSPANTRSSLKSMSKSTPSSLSNPASRKVDFSQPILEVGFDIERYMGKWYEAARFPQPFDINTPWATAEYTLKDDGNVEVLNTAYNVDGTIRGQIVGTAEFVEGMSDAELYVSFPTGQPRPKQLTPNYIVHKTDYDTYAVVGSYDKSNLYLLVRERPIKKELYQFLVDYIVSIGYDKSKLKRDTQAVE